MNTKCFIFFFKETIGGKDDNDFWVLLCFKKKELLKRICLATKKYVLF